MRKLLKTKQLKNGTIEIKASEALVNSDCLKQYVDIKTVEVCRNGCPNYGICKSCNCKSNKPCKHPKEMCYSMEATHLDANRLSKEVLAHPLLWYSNKILPEYTSAVSMLLTNMETDISALRSMIQDIFEAIV